MSNEMTSPDDRSLDQQLDRLEREMIREDTLEMRCSGGCSTD